MKTGRRNKRGIRELALDSDEIIVHRIWDEKDEYGDVTVFCEARVNVYTKDGKCYGTVAQIELYEQD